MINTTAARIKELRQRAGMTQDDLAARLGMTRSAISLIESGKNGAREITLRALAQAFGVSTSYLLKGEGEKPDDGHASFITLKYTDKFYHDRLLTGKGNFPESTVSYEEILDQAEDELGKTPGAYCSRKAAIRAMELLENMLQPISEVAEAQPLEATPKEWEQIVSQVAERLIADEEIRNSAIAAKAKAQAELESEHVVYRVSGKSTPGLPYEGLLTARLNMTEEEAQHLIEAGSLTTWSIGESRQIANWRVSEKSVRDFLNKCIIDFSQIKAV